jgi:dipeptidyl aminopeptidase/acylaminoacyl peptidase
MRRPRQSGRTPSKAISIPLSALFCWLAAAHGANAVPIAVYGGLPDVEDVALSPDGSRIAYVRTEKDTRLILVASVADQKLIRYVRVGEEKLRSVDWADDDNVLITTSVTTAAYGFKVEASLLRAYNVAKNEIKPLPGNAPGNDEHVLNTVVGDVMVRHVEGHTVIFVPALQVKDGIALVRCDLTSGINRVVKVGPSSTMWLVDAQGQLAAQQDYDAQTQHWSIGVFRGGILHEAASGHAALDVPEMLGFGPTADTLLVHTAEDGHSLMKLLSMTDGKLGGPMSGGSFNVPLSEPLTGRLIGGMSLEDGPTYEFFDPVIEERWKAIVKGFEGAQIGLASAAADFSKVLVLVEGGKFGYRYELIDLVKPKATMVGKVYAGIDDPLEVRRVTYAAADGLEIPAYLTLPRGREPRKLPLVVLPHGGPAARDTREFDWWSQALADQGYAVLQPNYRGSTVSQHFLEAGYGQWGRKMQTDLSDGVRYLAKGGIADAARVCIVGASYGGYAALAGVTFDPGVYRCAVSVAGLSDLAQMLRWEGRGLMDARGVSRYWDRFWGASGSSDPLLNSLSPVKHVDAVKVPVLLVHGRDDTVVPFEQSQMMFDALKAGKKDVTLITLNKEDHWLSRGETRLQMLDATVAFLRAHNPPD